MIIPAANRQHLMLRRDVIEAVGRGRFHIHCVAVADDAIELLTDLDAGRRDERGRFPEDSINGRVSAGLKAFARRRREFVGPKSGSDPLEG